MTLTNFDSSLLSLKKREKALNTWKRYNDTLVITGDSVLKEQPTFQSGSVVNSRKMGASVCGCNSKKDASVNDYPFNGLSQSNQVQ